MTSSEGTPHTLDFASYKLLSFDIYGTLIDWETGIYNGLVTNLQSIPALSNALSSEQTARKSLLDRYEAAERRIQSENPSMLAEKVHENCFLAIASALRDETGSSGGGDSGSDSSEPSLQQAAHAFAQTVANWPAFPDTVDAMKRLAKHYKLVPLSNIDRFSFSLTLAGPLHGVPFAAHYLAEDIGSYKPDQRNFDYLIERAREDLGVVDKKEILHVAQSLFHDHVPAEKAGLTHVWVDRKGIMGTVMESGDQKQLEGARWDWRVETLGELADIVEAALGKGGDTSGGPHKRYIH